MTCTSTHNTPTRRVCFACLPSRNKRGSDLFALEGIVPDAANWPVGCRFAERCIKKIEGLCESTPSPVFNGVRCHLLDPARK